MSIPHPQAAPPWSGGNQARQDYLDRRVSPASPLRLGLQSAASNDFAKPQQPNNAVAEDNRYLLRPRVSTGKDKIVKTAITV